MRVKKIVPMEPISKELIYMKVADAIHGYIHANKLKAGDKIPAERELAAQLQTGRNSVREALRVLQNEGIVDVRIGKGAFVSMGASPDSIYFRLFKVNYSELLQIKTLLEQEAISDAVRLASDEQIAAIEPPLMALEADAKNGEYNSRTDRHFHFALLEMARNKTLAQMVRNLIDQLNDYAKVLKQSDLVWIDTVPHHRTLFDAMLARDIDAALAAHDEILRIDIAVLNRVANGDT